MPQSFFADGVGHIGMVSGMVRIEFLTASPADKEGRTVSIYDPQFSIVLTPQAFAQTFGKMEILANSMVEAGVLFRRAEERREGPARDAMSLPIEHERVKSENPDSQE